MERFLILKSSNPLHCNDSIPLGNDYEISHYPGILLKQWFN